MWGLSGDNWSEREMTFCDGLAKPRVRLRYLCLAIALFAVGPLSSQAKAEGLEGPSFRKGTCHFVRTLPLIAHRKTKQRLQERHIPRCVDPPVPMKPTFPPPSLGNCVSAKP